MDTGQKYYKTNTGFQSLAGGVNTPQGENWQEVNYNDFLTGARQQGLASLQKYRNQSTSYDPGMGDANRRAAQNAFNEYGGQSAFDTLSNWQQGGSLTSQQLDALSKSTRLSSNLFNPQATSGVTMVNGIPTATNAINPATGKVDINQDLSRQAQTGAGAIQNFNTQTGQVVPPVAGQLGAINQDLSNQANSGVGAIPNFNTQTGQATSSNAGSQLGAVSGTTGTGVGSTGTSTSQSDLEGQYAALLGKSPEEIAAQKAIDDQNNAMRTGQANLAEQPIGMQFISGQQKSLEDRNTNLQIPLAQQLANAQQKRQASLDAIKFSLERDDKKKQSALDEAYRTKTLDSKSTSVSDKYGTGTIGEYNFAKENGYKGTFIDYQNEDANRKKSIAKAGATQYGGYDTQQTKAIDQINATIAKNPTYIKYGSMQTYANNIDAALSQGSGTGDIAAINQFQKVIDEGAVTRDQDVKLIQSSQSLMNTLKTKINKLAKGDQLSTQQRQQISSLTNQMVNNQKNALDKDAAYLAQKAKLERYKLDPSETIIGEISNSKTDGVTGGTSGTTPSGIKYTVK